MSDCGIYNKCIEKNSVFCAILMNTVKNHQKYGFRFIGYVAKSR